MRLNMEDIIIKIHNASASYKNFILQPVNMDIPKGYIIGIEGRNGAGKTTFLKMLLGAFPKMQGVITICGTDIIKEHAKSLEKICFISEDRVFFEEKDPVANEKYFSPFYKNWNHQIYKEMLAKSNISFGKPLKNFSKGERIKFQLAFAAASQPEVLLLDEPDTSLDPVYRINFLHELQEFVAKYQATIMLSSHLNSELAQIADYIIRIENGVCTWKENW